MVSDESFAVRIALTHIRAWAGRDWERTRELLAPDVHAVVTTTNGSRPIVELTGVDHDMEPKKAASRLIEPDSLHVVSALGNDTNAPILLTLRIGLGPEGAMVTMARAIAYQLDAAQKIKEKRDEYFIEN
jgi:hypothetical protein